ncbi:hypothetical protein DYI22_17415, partial [Marinobacter lipolyticus]|nr:hypothetical protein [Marinobacter lipolyticus]
MDLQHAAHDPDPELLLVSPDEAILYSDSLAKNAAVDSTGQCNIMHTGNYRGFQNAAASIKDQRADPSAEAGAMGSM